MKFTITRRLAQPLHAVLVSLLLLGPISCASGARSSRVPPPSDPTAAVRSFLDAVRANSLVVMAQLWGSSSGLAADDLDQDELNQRLTVMQIYLSHESYAIVPRSPSALMDTEPDEQVVFVRLMRKGCTPVVPFTLAPYRNGWLVRNIDLEAAGNPARACPRGVPPERHAA
jgi:hypothetical protein